MVVQKFLIGNKSGLHVRPAGVLVKALQQYKSSVKFKFNDKEFNGKSILGIMSACVKCGQEVEFIVEGEDEVQAMEAIAAAIASGLGE